MTSKDAASKGGKVYGEMIAKAAIDRYYEDPIYCLECKKIIHPKPKERIYNVRKRKFCSRSCAITYNNSQCPKRKARKTGNCERCGVIIEFKKTSSGKYTPRKYCKTCLPFAKIETLSKGMGYKTTKPMKELTKKEYLDRKGNYMAARNNVASLARRLYTASGKLKTCAICDFPHGVQICHKTSVADFPDTALIKEINHIDNLIALCPNHHWMLDHGLLELDKEMVVEHGGSAIG
jgi:hypothetical protein